MGLAGAALGVSALGVGVNVVNGIDSSNASKNAAAAQTAAANQAAQTQLSMYNQTAQNLSPFTSQGSNAFSQLANMFGFGNNTGSGITSTTGAAGSMGTPNSALMMQNLANTPGYQFGLQQGQQALDRSAASQGLVLSGAQQKASQEFGTNYATANAWQPYVNQLNSAASLGENAGAMVGNAGTQAAAGAASSQLAAGQSTAAGIVGSNNAINSMISGLTGSGQGGISSLLSSYGGLATGANTSLSTNDGVGFQSADGMNALY